MQLTPWPLPRPANWAQKVNEPIQAAELNRLRLHIQRGRPYGEPAWTANAIKRMGLQWTIRDRGRPKRRKTTEKER